MSFKKSFRVLIVFIGIIVLSSCTKEKAEAVQLAAEQFRVDAISAIDQINYIFLQDISIAKMSEEQQIEETIELLTLVPLDSLNSKLISDQSKSFNPGDNAVMITNEPFVELEKQYYQFEEMFASLDRGSYFAKDAVKDAGTVYVNLTAQLINYANILRVNEFKFAASRSAILTKMQDAKADNANKALQMELYKKYSIALVQLVKEEKETQERAIRLCYKAAESGRVVTDLIQHYGDMNVGDILNMIKGSMNFAMEITNGNQNIADLATKFDAVEQTIRNNPDYNDVIEKKVISGN